jgi:sugar lactone lactonase YvrE
VADTVNDTVRQITPSGVVTTLAGAAGQTGSADTVGGPARFSGPEGVATDGAGNVYVADGGNGTIRKIASGAVTTLAGTAGVFGNADGTGAAATFEFPMGVGTDSANNVYVADAQNHNIRKVTPAGVVTTLAGPAGVVGLGGTTDANGNSARFNGPSGVAVDSAGNVFVADTGNHTIRKITPAGDVTTFAGTALTSGSSDGTGTAARFSFPSGLAIDGSGNLYVADSGNGTIRKITPTGVVTTIAGVAGQAGFQMGTLPGRLTGPVGVAVSGTSLYIVLQTLNCVVVLTNRP